MKKPTFQTWSLAFALTVLPLLAGCDQEQANSAPITAPVTNQAAAADASAAVSPPLDATGSDTNPPTPEAMDEQLSEAQGTIISTPNAASAVTSHNPELNEVVKLVQAGMGEPVLMAYITNSPAAFNVSSDDLIYLNDLGVPETVITAMLQRDQYINANAAPAQPAETNLAPAPGPAAPEDQNTMAQVPESVETPPLAPPESVVQDVEQSPNGSYTYFYDSLAPYGNWVDIQGYGPCWQPTVVVANPTWQPYCDRGHWAYTDSGWCWVSDYSWGWGPFHYGRWFRHGRFGWCWAPDTVWGPAWVSWRYTDAYCGWAALPPTACYRPGFGFTYFGSSVGFNFSFGLNSSCFVFVPLDRCHDRFPAHYRVPHREVTKIFNTTTVNNTIIRGNNNTIINRGVPVDKVAAASHTEIKPIRIHADANGPRTSQLERDGRSLSVFRPALPTPKPLGKTALVGEGVQRDKNFSLPSRINRSPEIANRNPQQQQTPGINPGHQATPDHRPIISNPTAMTPRNDGQPGNGNSGRNPSQPNVEKPASPIWKGNQGPYHPPTLTESPNNPRPSSVFQSQSPVQQATPGDNAAGNNNRNDNGNNRHSFAPAHSQQPDQPVQAQPTPQPQNPAAPVFNHPVNNNPNRVAPSQQWQQRQLLQQQQPAPAQQEAATPVYQVPQQSHPNRDFGPAVRPETVAPPRVIERQSPDMGAPRTFQQPQVQQQAPPQQFSAPANPGNAGGHGAGGGAGGGGNGGGGGGNSGGHGGGGGGSGGGGGGGGGHGNDNSQGTGGSGGGGHGGR